MPVLRELITRFSFETNKADVKKFESTIGGMKGSLTKLAAVFGVSLGGKALFNMGVSLKQSEENLRLFAGVNLDNVNNNLDLMQQRLGNIQDGAENIIRRKTLNVLATSFIKEFGSANEEVKLLTELLEAAALQKLATGADISETFAGLLTGVRTGGLGAFVDLPGFDLERKREREFKLAVQDPGDPTGKIGQAQRQQEVSNILKSLMQELRAAAFAVSPELVGVAVGKEIIIEAAEKAAEVATIAGVKAALAAIKSITDTGDVIPDTGNLLLDESKTGALGLIHQSINRMRQRQQERVNTVNNKDNTINNRANIVNNIEVNSVFHINESTNAKETAEIVDKRILKVIDDASFQVQGSGEQR